MKQAIAMLAFIIVVYGGVNLFNAFTSYVSRKFGSKAARNLEYTVIIASIAILAVYAR